MENGGRVCRFNCLNDATERMIVKTDHTERWTYVCEECLKVYAEHGMTVCSNCGNLELRYSGQFRFDTVSECEACPAGHRVPAFAHVAL